jgi:hypothetical protein
MRAKRPKIPTPRPLSSALTTAAWVGPAGESMGVVQLEPAGALKVGALVLAKGEGVAAGTATAGATGTAAPPAAGAAGRGTAAVGAGTRAAAGAGGFGLAGTGAGAGAGAPVRAGAGAGAGPGAAGDVVGAGAGVLGAGTAVAGGVAGHCSGWQVVALTGPPDATEAVSASTEAASPGIRRVRRRVGRIMWLPLLGAQGSPAAGLSRVSSYTLLPITKLPTGGFPAAARSASCVPCPCPQRSPARE